MSAESRGPELYIIPVSDSWMDEFDQTVRSPILLDGAKFPSEIEGAEERVWGMEEGPRNQPTFEQMSARDWVVFYHDGRLFSCGRIGRKLQGRDFGRTFWSNPSSQFCFTIEDFDLLDIPIDDLRNTLGYQSGFYPRGPIRVSDESLGKLLAEFSSVRNYLNGFRESEMPDENEIASDFILPKRIETQSSRIIRNTNLVNELKRDHDFRCQVCDDQRKRDPSSPYAEGHHLQPLGSPHQGPDIKENIIVLCPNHHADFDYGMVKVEPATLEIEHAYDNDVCGSELTVIPEHQIDHEFLRYHNENIVGW